MEATYNELTSAIDAREILRYLNQLGIHNISGEILKHFITDLKKLIRYELKQKAGESDEHFTKLGPERLHSATTFSSRIRSKVNNGATNCSRDCEKRKPLTIRNIRSAPELGKRKIEEKPLRRACSCVRVEKKTDVQAKESCAPSLSNNLIRVTKPVALKKSDPVTLYHYYSSLWEKYKSNVPGENNWADLRWNVRQKMAGNIPVQSQKVAFKK